jgi:DNA-binding IclR family transcriptional regulator
VSGVGVLDKVMAILHAFPDGATRLQPPAVAAQLRITGPTAYRLMASMAEHGLLARDQQGYRLGVSLLHLGARVAEGLELNHVARPYLEWLRDQTSENAELHVRHGHTRVPTEVVASSQNLRPMGQVGVPLPVHAGASGKVLLAWLDIDARQALALDSHRADQQSGDFEMARWERELEATRARGWAASDGEREAGVSAIGAPVRDQSGSVVAAVVLSGPSARLTPPDVRAHAVEATLEAARRVSLANGHDGRSLRSSPA